MSDIEFVGSLPAPYGGKAVITSEVLAALKSRPGEWACIARSKKSTQFAYAFVQRQPDFETTSRRQPSGMFDVYMRFVGEQS